MKATVTTKELSDILGLTDRQIQKHAAAGIFKRSGRGLYPLAATVRAYIAFIKQNTRGDAESLTAERTRLTRAQADQAEMENKTLTGELIPVAEIETIWTAIVLHVRNGFLNLAGKLSPRLAQEDKLEAVHKILDDEVYDILSVLSKTPPVTANKKAGGKK